MNRTNRVTLRLQNSIISEFQKEADKKDLPLSSLMAKSLNKIVSFDMKYKSIPKIIIPKVLLDEIIEEIPDSSIKKIARNFGPKLAKKTVLVSDAKKYTIDSVIENHFLSLAKYCKWFRFDHQVQNPHYTISFEIDASGAIGSNAKWMLFLSVYVRSILESLRIHIDDEIIEDNILIFKIVKS